MQLIINKILYGDDCFKTQQFITQDSKRPVHYFDQNTDYQRPLMLTIVQLSALNDNYIYLLHEPQSQETAVVDPTIAEPILAFLDAQNWPLTYIFNTHHHWDHIGGNNELKSHTHCQIISSTVDQQRIPGVDKGVSSADSLFLGHQQIRILETPGHTQGHISYYAPESHALFCGDTLFGMGCGRLLEGTAAQLWQSLQKLKALPADTRVYCAHEYTQNNGCFALTVEPNNQPLQIRINQVQQLRQANLSTVPSTLAS